MAHELKITVEDVFQDQKYIRVADWSVYDKYLPVTNRVTKVEIPGQQTFKLIPLPQGGSFAYTSKSLKISKTIEGLPDGLWIFTYSICPNERKYTKVYHFRTVELENALYGYMAKVLGGCIDSEVNSILIECALKIQALKTNSIDNNNCQKAYDLYTEVQSSINSLLIK